MSDQHNIGNRAVSENIPQIDALELAQLKSALLQQKADLMKAQQSESAEIHPVAKDFWSLLKRYISQLIERRYLNYIDFYFAEFTAKNRIYKEADAGLGYCLLTLLVSRAYGLGHTALPQQILVAPHQWFLESNDPNIAQEQAFILKLFLGLEMDSSTSIIADRWSEVTQTLSTPLVKNDFGFYLDRHYQQESAIVDFFHHIEEKEFSEAAMQFLQERLDHYFPIKEEEVDWQKFAAANTLLNHVSVISGGPGTGKTTTVFKILQILIDLYYAEHGENVERPFSIYLAAPTGKATARLSESILAQIRQLQTSVIDAPLAVQEKAQLQISLIPHNGQTLHRLLMINPFTRKPQFDAHNPLDFDLLVVDEASMIDQQMLVQLIRAVSSKGRIIFLGDKDQLASVEAGSIMHELCACENYSKHHFDQLKSLLSTSKMPDEDTLVRRERAPFNYLSFLKKSYRFDTNSGLGQLAAVVNNLQHQSFQEQYSALETLLEMESQLSDSDRSVELTTLPASNAALEACFITEFSLYKAALKQYSKGELDVAALFKVFTEVGVLAARRTGINGAIDLNQRIRQILFPRDYRREFFHGLPIMVTHNSSENQLFNGDIGLILEDEAGSLVAYFEGIDAPRRFSIHALPQFETAFAMTIHKSQGSEFKRVLLFLGDEPSIVLTKELFYTGITRAKKSVHIFSSDSALKRALKGRVERYSFIHKRLENLHLFT